LVEDNHPDKRWDELTEHMLVIYGLICHVLKQLPLPIEIPQLDAEWDAVTAIQALQRTRADLIQAQPIGTVDKGMIERSLLDWLTAYDMGAFIKVAGPAPWRLDTLDYAFNRIITFMDRVAASLGIDLEPPESE
jgi:hypothetical protein